MMDRNFLTKIVACWLLAAGVSGPSSMMAQLKDESIAAALQYSKERAGAALVIKERGRLRLEQYYNGHTANAAIHIYSGTKSFFGVLALQAEEEGLLQLDERVADTIPEWRQDARKSQITIRELLNFTSGLESGFQQLYGRSTADKLEMSLGLRVPYERGQAFVYGPSHLQVFAEVMRRKLKDRQLSYESYMERRLLKPLQINVSRWRADSHGNVFPSAGMHMRGRDWMNFGDLIVSGGTYRHRRLVKTDHLAQCFRGTEISPSYGLTFWLNHYAARPDSREIDVEQWLGREPLPTDWSRGCISQHAPTDMIVCLGSNAQRLYIVPSRQLVVMHLGNKGDRFRDAEFLKLLFAGTSPSEYDQPEMGPGRAERKGLRRLFRQ